MQVKALGAALVAIGAFLTPIPGPMRAILLAPLIPEPVARRIRKAMSKARALDKAACWVERKVKGRKLASRFTLERIVASYLLCWILGPPLLAAGLALLAR